MARGFWDKLQSGFLALAPMEDVTDTTFRRMVISCGRPDVCFTEFTNVDAIVHAIRNPKNSLLELPISLRSSGSLRADFFGVPALLERLVFTEIERPIVAQIWGTDPEKFNKAARIIKELGFDGVDINFGCPVRDVVKLGACSAMIGKNSQVKEIIEAVGESGLPVSVKTRIGFKEIITEDWIGFLLSQELAAITVHGRTAAEKSDAPAHWGEIGKAVRLRNQMQASRARIVRARTTGLASLAGIAARANLAHTSPFSTLMIGNGDVKSREEAKRKVEEYGVDGVMIGRGVLENPAIFNSQFLILNQSQKIKLLKQHLELWRETWGEKKNFSAFKKYVKIYVRDFEGASEARTELMTAKSAEDLSRMCVKMWPETNNA